MTDKMRTGAMIECDADHWNASQVLTGKLKVVGAWVADGLKTIKKIGNGLNRQSDLSQINNQTQRDTSGRSSSRSSRSITSFSKNVLLAYLSGLAKNMKPSTLWSQYSMLKSMISAKHNVDISSYQKVNAFLKRSLGFKSKKSKVLTTDEISTFLNEAPDLQNLATKVAPVLGVAGACRRDELCKITVQDINDKGSMAVITLPDTKTKIQRSFTIVGEFYNTFRKYATLRPQNTTTNRFFLNYQNGRCTQQVIGVNKFGGMPKQIASYLNLPDPDSYTGHSFRRSSATILADTGADITTLKRHGGWKSNQVAEGYIEDSVANKTKIGKQITDAVHVHPSTATLISAVRDSDAHLIHEGPTCPNKVRIVADAFETNFGASSSKNTEETTTASDGPLNFNNCSNITINII